MNDPGSEGRPLSSGAHRIKDRRTLVLFLFGALILAADLPRQPDGLPPVHGYAVEGGRGAGWRLVRDPRIPAVGTAGNLPLFILSADRAIDKQPLLNRLDGIADLPPELFPFLDCPMPINRADARGLQLLPGVGPHLANEIVATRQRLGRFAGPEQLEQAKGIGPARLQQLLPRISFQ